MAEKILSIKLTGDSSSLDSTLQKSTSILNGLGLTADNVKTKLNESTKQFELNLTTTATRVKLLQQAFADLHAINLNPKNIGTITDNISKARATAFGVGAQNTGNALNNRLALEQSTRINGANSIKTIELKAAQDEKAIRDQLAKDILAIEKQVSDGTISTIRAANQQKVQLERQAAKDITDIRKNTEKEQSTIKRRADSADIYKQETRQVEKALNDRLTLERTIRLNGINSIQAIEIRAAQQEEAIRRTSTQRLLQIEEQLRNGTISNRGAANASRNAILQQTATQITANRITLEAAQATAQHNTQLRATQQAHISLFAKVGEFIGLYQIWNLAINTVTNSLKAIPKIGIELEATFASLSASTGTQAGAIAGMRFLREEAERTGIPIATLRETFRGFQASTSLAGESMKTTVSIFKSMNTVITGLHLPADKASGIFLALAQIFNKTKVQSEELVKQLGNLIPGAFAAFAAANRGQFASSAILIAEMKKGTVFAHETVERFATFLESRFSAAFAIASTGFNANIGRMQSSLTFLGESLYKVSSGSMNSFVKGITTVAKALGSDTGLTILGESIKLIAGTIIALALPALYRFTLGLFELRTAEQAAAIAAGYATTANNALTTSAANAARALEAQTLATVGTTAASRGLSAILSFFKSPATIVIGIGLIAKEFWDMSNAGDAAAASLEEFLAEDRKRKLEASKEQPTTSELRTTVFDDPNVKQRISEIAQLEIETKKLAKRIEIIQKNNIGGPLEELNKEFFAKVRKITEAKEALVRAMGGIADSIESAVNANKPPPIDFLEGIEELTIENFDKKGRAIEAATKRFVKANASLFKAATDTITAATPPRLLPENYSQEQYDNAKQYIIAYNEGLQLTKDTVSKLADANTSQSKGIYEISKNYIKNQSDLFKATIDESIAKINASINELETKAAIAKARQEPVNELGYINAIGNRQRQLLEERLSLELKLKQLRSESIETQVVSLSKQTTELSKVWEALQKIETSGKNRSAQVSPKGAIGQEQILPSTLNKYINVPSNVLAAGNRAYNDRLTSSDKNILSSYAVTHTKETAEAALAYFKEQLDKNKGDYIKAAAAYNAGPGNLNIAESKAAKQGGSYVQYLPKETQNYVANLSTSLDEESKGAVTLKDTLTDISQIETQILSIKYEEAALSNRIAVQTAEYEGKRKQLHQELAIEAKQASGNIDEANIDRLIIEYKARKLELENAGLNVNTALLDKIFKQKLLSQELSKIQERKTAAEQLYQNKVEETNTLLNAGIIASTDVAKLLTESKQEYLKAQDLEIAKLKEINTLESKRSLALIEQAKAQERAQSIAAGQNIITQGDTSGLIGPTNTRESQLAIADKAREDALAQKNLTAQQITDIEDRYLQQRLSLNLQYAQNVASIEAGNLQTITGTLAKVYGEQSKQAKAAFLLYKTAKSAEIVSSTASAAMGAYSAMSSIPYVGPVLGGVAAAAAIAFGAAQLANLASAPMPQAHGGLDYVPENNKTYLLSKGERVLQPNANKDLTKALQSGTLNQSKQPVVNNNNKIINVLDPSIVGDYLSTTEGENMIVNIMNKNQAA